MRNLCQICHFHKGSKKDRVIKVAAGFLVATALTVWASTGSIRAAQEEQLYLLANTLPEPILSAAATDESTSTAPAPTPADVYLPPPPPPPMSVGGEGENGDFQEPQDYCDPREGKDALRQVKQQKREVARIGRQIKKLTNLANELQKLQTLEQTILAFEANLKNPPAGDTICDAARDYWDSQLWEDINDLRRVVELPRELNFLMRDLRRLDRMVNKSKSFKKRLEPMGINWPTLQTNVNGMQSAYDSARAAYQSGDFEGTEDALQEIREGTHPGEVQGVMFQLRDLYQRTRFIKDDEIQAALQDLWLPVVEAFNEGEYRDARESLEPIMQQIYEILPVLYDLQGKRTGRAGAFKKLEKLEELLRSRLEESEQQDGESPEEVEFEFEEGSLHGLR